MKHVRATKTGRLLRLVDAPIPEHVRRTSERNRETDALIRTIDNAMKGVPTVEDNFGLTASGSLYNTTPLTPKTLAMGLAQAGLVKKPSDCIRDEASFDADTIAQVREADTELARLNFASASRRAKQPCFCADPKERSCASCVARDDILRSRGDWL